MSVITQDLLSEAEQRRLLVEWNDTRTDYPTYQCLHELFESQVELTPDALAVISGDACLTYRELNGRANQLAHHLLTAGLGREELVGICVERSLEMVVGLLGVLKAGGAYVPLDPAYPKERLAFMVEDSRASFLLTQRPLLELFPEHRARVVCLDAKWETFAKNSQENPARRAMPENLAYVIYTSGSTGRPKGVAIEHRSAVSLIYWARDSFSPEKLAGVLASTSICFDLSIFELFVPLSWGGKTIVAQNALHLPTLPAAPQVTLINTVPSAMAELLRAGGVPQSVRTVCLAGEPLTTRLVNQLYEHRTIQHVFDLYGPSEATTYSTCALRAPGAPPTIGRPIANTQIYLLDPHMRPVPIGDTGELYIGGAGLARGYLNRPELTAEKFVPNPFSNEPGARLYKTGDLARYRQDGNIEFLGRIDHQVKIRGFRIELGEIETVLTRHPAVRDAIVSAREDEPGDKRLVAYVIPREKAALSIGDLRRFLRQTLPSHMVPQAFVFLDVFPLTPNGKVDKKALPAPDRIRPELEREYVAPRTRSEEILAEMWADLLGLSRVGVFDNFFELGGHSLAATRLISRVREVFHADLPLVSIFNAPTVAGLATLIEQADSSAQDQPCASIQPVPRNGPFPLSFTQERIWFIQQLDPANRAYTFQATLRFRGPLDVAALQESLNEIVRRHEIFRTTFPSENGQPVQVIHDFEPVHVPHVDLRTVPESERERAVQQLIHDELRKPFDIATLPLIRWMLIRLRADEHLLLQVEHHLVHDGWSFNVFLSELRELYAAFSSGKPSPLPPLPIQLADFAHWQRQWMQGEVTETQLAYWKKKLAGNPPVLELPSDRPRPAVQRYQGRQQRVEFPLSLCEALRAFSRQEGVTLFMAMLAALEVLLHRYTGQEDFSVGSGIANRRWRETEALIGMMLNTVAFRADLSGDPTVRELLERVRTTTLEAYTHQDLPFDRIVQALSPERSLSHSPLFQVMLGFHDAPVPDLDFPGLTVDLVEALGNGSAKFDLNLTIIPRSEQRVGRGPASDAQGITQIWEYDTDLFDDATITRMLSHFQTVLEEMIANPGLRVSELPLLTESERRQLLIDWNDTKSDFPSDQCIHQLFEAQAKRTPDAIAVAFEQTQMTYAELNTRANQLARYLRGLGVRPEMPIGIHMDRSPELVTALMGVLKAGGAYVPLDPTYPKDRLAFMLEDARLPVLLTERRLVDSLPRHRARVVCLDSDWEAIAQDRREDIASGVTAEHLAYVIYTSGSTGRPKGVEVPHRGVVNLLTAMRECVDFTAKDVMLAVTSLSFDIAALELFLPLVSGAKVVVVSREVASDGGQLRQAITECGATLMQATPATWQLLLESGWQAPGALTVLCGGEALPSDLAAALCQRSASVWNVYGPTETTIWSTAHKIDGRELRQTTVPIGRPIANTTVYILDPGLRPVPIGVRGELYIGGAGLARGYAARPELTAERFVPNPLSDEPGARLYKTGDLARYLPDGTIEFLGRIDQQVKIRGSRIELGEIEAVLNQHPAVRQAVVAARENIPGDKRLIAYMVANQPAPSADELRSFLKHTLPEFMVPAAFVILEALPLTPNGKIDRRALPLPKQELMRPETCLAEPRTPLERTLAEIWSQVLGLKQVGVHDNFFELGGHSLLATRLLSRVRQALDVEVPLRSLFEGPTIAGLAIAVIQSQAKEQHLSHILTELDALSDEDVQRLLTHEGSAAEKRPDAPPSR